MSADSEYVARYQHTYRHARSRDLSSITNHPFGDVPTIMEKQSVYTFLDRTATDSLASTTAPQSRVDLPLDDIDRGLTTRNLCILALILGWATSFASLSVGIYIIVARPIQVPSFLLDRTSVIGGVGFSWVSAPDNPYILDHRVYSLPKDAMLLVGLLLNISLTAIFDSMNFIHAVSLRWALWRESRLQYNSNHRLFTSAKNHSPNRWPSNIVFCIALVVAYGSANSLASNVYVVGVTTVENGVVGTTYSVPGPRYGLDFNAWGLIGLGTGLLLQAIFCTWCLLHKGSCMKSWNSNPLATARACKSMVQTCEVALNYDCCFRVTSNPETFRSDVSAPKGSIPIFEPHPAVRLCSQGQDECKTGHSVSSLGLVPLSASDKIVSIPLKRQLPARSLVPQTRQIAALVWILFAMISLWTIIIGIIADRTNNTSAEFVQQNGGRDDFLSYWENYGQITIAYNGDPYHKRLEWRGLIAQCLVFSPILVSLHFVEVLTHLVRDEQIWRKAATTGTEPNSNNLFQNVSNWPGWLLFAFKSIVPWIFGYAFSCNSAIIMALLPLIVLAVLFLLLAVFAESLTRWRPKGPQPATFGNVPALLVLVDEWNHKKLFWGDKRPVADGIGAAGTSGSRLADLKMNRLYTGLKVNLGCHSPRLATPKDGLHITQSSRSLFP